MLPELATPFHWEGDHIAAEAGGGPAAFTTPPGRGAGGARALFTTRRGGVSGGPFDSLNLGIKTADERANVEENRARVAAAAGCDWERFQFGWQVHGGTVRRATETRSQVTQEDGQATALSGHPAL